MNCIQRIQSQHLSKCSLATCASIYSICISDPSWLAQQMCMKCPLIFQFHKGAIETICVTCHLVDKCDFQFHKGAIETRQDSVLGVFDPCFNPRAHVERNEIRVFGRII